MPDTVVEVPFLNDYGPGNPSVKYPRVEDQVYHPTLIEHATRYNTEGNYLFVSYSTTLHYSDEEVFMETPEDVCGGGSLADVSRLWTTSDRCGNTQSWTQTIRVVKPSNPLFADASGYQLATPNGYLQLRNSHIAQNVLSEGESFGMWDSTIYCGGNSCPDASSHASLVLGSCPKHKLEESSLPDGTITYRATNGGKKFMLLRSCRKVFPFFSSSNDWYCIFLFAEKCNVFKSGKKSTKDYIAVPSNDFPLDFQSTTESISSFARTCLLYTSPSPRD